MDERDWNQSRARDLHNIYISFHNWMTHSKKSKMKEKERQKWESSKEMRNMWQKINKWCEGKNARRKTSAKMWNGAWTSFRFPFSLSFSRKTWESSKFLISSLPMLQQNVSQNGRERMGPWAMMSSTFMRCSMEQKWNNLEQGGTVAKACQN